MKMISWEQQFVLIEQILHKYALLKIDQLRAIVRLSSGKFEIELLKWVAKYKFQIVGDSIDFSQGDLNGFFAELRMVYVIEAKPSHLISAVLIFRWSVPCRFCIIFLIMAFSTYEGYTLLIRITTPKLDGMRVILLILCLLPYFGVFYLP